MLLAVACRGGSVIRLPVAAVVSALALSGAGAATAGHAEVSWDAAGVARSVPASAPARALPSPLYGVTIDNVADLPAIVASSRSLGHRPTTRIYFDVKHGARYYLSAVTTLRQSSYLMGELLDSSDETKISTSAFSRRVESYLTALGRRVDIWEIGNEVNGNWTGPYATVSAKLRAAYHDVAARGYATALTLYYNAHCGDGSHELSPTAFSSRYVPRAVRAGLGYVFVSYYEDACHHIRPSATTWTSFFRRLHALYPSARLGFGEVGMTSPATPATLATAKSLLTHYYSLRIPLPYFAGGYFWWYYYEDCLPHTTKPLWPVLNAGFADEAAAFGGGRFPARSALSR
jgi:hypothetical protein